MGSDQREDVMLKRNLRLTVKKVDTTSLKALSQLLKIPQRLTLQRKYGKVLKLLEVDVQVEAITALVQYYDPPLRCFTFEDFQMAPTLEEYEQIIGLSLKGTKPYHYVGHYPSLQTIAGVLKVHPKELQAAQQNKNETKGFPKEYLEKHMCRLAQQGDWDTFIDVLALTAYGIVLFPNIDNYVDFAAIDVFLAKKFRSESPVTALLADVYCTMNYCHKHN